MPRLLFLLAGLAAAVLAVGSASLAATGRSATPAGVTETPLPVVPFYEPYMAVDTLGQHVFVAASEGTSSIYVLDFDGNLVTTITGEQGASGMVVDTATHTLYVADYDATAIAEIDTQTLTETARFSTAPFAGAYDLAIAGGKLWFTTAANGAGTVAYANLNGTGIASAGIGDSVPELVTSSADGSLLALADHESEPPNVYVYNVSGNAPTLVSNAFDPGGNSGYTNDVSFDASGNNLLLATATPSYIQQLSTSTLLSSGSYPTGAFPSAVAASADGQYVAAGSGDGIAVYPTGGATPANTWGVAPFGHSLAFSADATRLFALSRASNNDLALETIDDPTLAPTTTSLSPSSADVKYGKSVTLTANVSGTTTGTVELDASVGGGAPAPVAFAQVNGSGQAQFTVSPTATTDYTAELKAGSGYGESTSLSTTVVVHPLITVTAHTRTRHHGRTPAEISLSGTITPVRRSQTLRFTIERHARTGAWRTVADVTARIGRSGTAQTTYRTKLKGPYRVRAHYDGDPKYGTAQSPGWTRFTVR